MRRVLFIAAMLISLSAVRAVASPTACNFMPISDVMETGTVRVELENDGYPKLFGGGSSTSVLAQVGITPRLEAGYDHFMESGDVEGAFNIKYQVVPESKAFPALSVGIMDIESGERSSYYVVAGKGFGNLTAYAGYFNGSYADGPMLGATYTIGQGLYLCSDWMSGSENFWSVGMSKDFGQGFNTCLYFGFPNEGDAEDFVGLNVNYTFKAW